MTNNHCPNPESIRPILTVDSMNRLDNFAEFISEKVYEFLENESFDGILGMPEDWDSCQTCERNVLNAQETLLAILEKRLLAAIRETGIFHD